MIIINGLSEGLNELAAQNNNNDDSGSDGLSGGIIALIVILILLAVSMPAIIVTVYMIYKKRHKGRFDIFKGIISPRNHRTGDFISNTTGAKSGCTSGQELQNSLVEGTMSSLTEPPTEKLIKAGDDTDEPEQFVVINETFDADTYL